MLLAPPGREYTRTLNRAIADLTEPELAAAIAEQSAQAATALANETEQFTTSVTCHCRYRGQSATLRLPGDTTLLDLTNAFHRAHREAFGFELDLPVELYTLQLSAEGRAIDFTPPAAPVGDSEPVAAEPFPVYDFDGPAPHSIINGHAVLKHSATTVFINEGWQGRRDVSGHWWLVRVQ